MLLTGTSQATLLQLIKINNGSTATAASADSSSTTGGDPCLSVSPLAASCQLRPGAIPPPAAGGTSTPAVQAPVFEYSPAPAGSSCWEATLGLDVLVLVAAGDVAGDAAGEVVGDALAAALRRQVEVVERVVAERVQVRAGVVCW